MVMIDLTCRHTLSAANAHFYKEPTEEMYIDRTIPYHDLVYLVEGSWCFTEDDTEYPLKKDDVLILAAGRHHYTKGRCAAGTKTFCLHVSCERGDQEGMDASELPSQLSARNSPVIKRYFEDIVSAYWTDAPNRAVKLDALVSLLLIALYEEKENQNAGRTDVAAKAIEILTEDPHMRCSASEMAQRLFVSTKTLDNAMKKKVGVPFYTYQKNRRLDMVAMQLEMEPEIKLHEIAIAYGYHDEFHLSKAFKQKFGVSPQEYRAKAVKTGNAE